MWAYPRPPTVETDDRRVRIVCGGRTIIDTRRALRVLETSHPPCWYLPIDALSGVQLAAPARSTWCEFKGRATYHDIVDDTGVLAAGAAWTYPRPSAGYELLVDHSSVYPADGSLPG